MLPLTSSIATKTVWSDNNSPECSWSKQTASLPLPLRRCRLSLSLQLMLMSVLSCLFESLSLILRYVSEEEKKKRPPLANRWTNRHLFFHITKEVGQALCRKQRRSFDARRAESVWRRRFSSSPKSIRRAAAASPRRGTALIPPTFPLTCNRTATAFWQAAAWMWCKI